MDCEAAYGGTKAAYEGMKAAAMVLVCLELVAAEGRVPVEMVVAEGLEVVGKGRDSWVATLALAVVAMARVELAVAVEVVTVVVAREVPADEEHEVVSKVAERRAGWAVAAMVVERMEVAWEADRKVAAATLVEVAALEAAMLAVTWAEEGQTEGGTGPVGGNNCIPWKTTPSADDKWADYAEDCALGCCSHGCKATLLACTHYI